MVFHHVMDFIYPRRCLICDCFVESETPRHVCDDCLLSFDLILDSSCLTCGRKLEGELERRKKCSDCEKIKHSYQEAMTLFRLGELEQRFVYALKYQNGFYLKYDFIALLEKASQFIQFLNESILIPVPLHPKKMRDRGYNQSELICRWLAEVVNTIDVMPCLERVRNTKSQTLLDKRERRKNVKNAFALREDFVLDKSRRWIVVDDVYTTGATIDACCRVLKNENSINNLYVLTLGHG
jgi:ComF family protein